MDHKFKIGYEGPDGKIVMLGDVNSIEECELTVTENCVVGDFIEEPVLEFECKVTKEMGDRIKHKGKFSE